MEAQAKTGYHLISAIEPDSIASDLGLVSGDVLLQMNGKPVADVFDYRLALQSEFIELQIRKIDGEIIEIEIEKDESEDLGILFEEALMDKSRFCHNKCLFCFIDQLPKGMRETLYFKDDDMRLSFLTGNYITLTNLSDAELDRLLSYHLSPMNISVHATNPAVRLQLLKNPKSVNILNQLKRIISAGIEINCQIVLCPGINDGEVLDQTLADLCALGEQVLSIAVVPVGITKFRTENGLPQVDRYTKQTAQQVIAQTERWQAVFMKKYGRRVFFAADEFYVRSGVTIPPAQAYEDLPQLENGVGMLALFKEQLDVGLEQRKMTGFEASEQVSVYQPAYDRFYLPTGERYADYLTAPRLTVSSIEVVHLFSGTDAAPWLDTFSLAIASVYGMDIQVHAVPNDFFGHTITVAGLLTGQDLKKAMHQVFDPLTDAQRASQLIVLPDCMFKQEEAVFLDDETPDALAKDIGVPILICSDQGESLLGALDEVKYRNEAKHG